MHDTRCINRLGLFITRRRVVETVRVVLAFVFPSAFAWCVVSKVGKPKEEFTSWLSHALLGCCGLMVAKRVLPIPSLPRIHTMH